MIKLDGEIGNDRKDGKIMFSNSKCTKVFRSTNDELVLANTLSFISVKGYLL